MKRDGDNDLLYFMDNYSDHLERIFNEVASKDTPEKTNVAFAQQGTKLLTPHKDYLGIPYKQDGDYNYFEAHPENIPTNPDEH